MEEREAALSDYLSMPAPHAIGARTILLIDDDEADLMFARRAFSQVAPAITLVDTTDPATAVALAAEVKPDLICTDFRMPSMDDGAAIDALRHAGGVDGRVIVVLSTSDHPLDVRRAYQGGANAFYVKPNSPDGYRALAAQLVSHWFGWARLEPASG